MIDVAKEIVITLINNKQIANYDNFDANINDVRKAIREICQELQNCKTIKTEYNNNSTND